MNKLNTMVNIIKTIGIIGLVGSISRATLELIKKDKEIEERKIIVYDIVKRLKKEKNGDRIINIYQPNEKDGETYQGVFTELVITEDVKSNEEMVASLETKGYNRKYIDKLMYSEVQKIYYTLGSDGRTTIVTVEI